MARQRRRLPRGSSLPLVLMGTITVCLLGMVGGGIAYVAGVFDSDDPVTTPVDRTGQLAFPALARNVPAFEKLTRDDFINPQTGQLNVIWAPKSIESVASRDMSELIGRVLSRDKRAGLILTEADLLEKGTRPGLSAGVPLGKFAISIPVEGVSGLEQLRYGDRFDLLVALPEGGGSEQLSNSEPAALFGGVKSPSLRVGQLSRRHGVKHLVTDGMLIQLYNGSKRSTTGSSGLTIRPGGDDRRDSVPTVFAELGVDGEEIGPLTEAISLGTKLTCIVRSGRPSDEVSEEFTTEGLVAVITTATPVSAFSGLSDENLIDEATGQLHYYYFKPEDVAETWITSPTELYGRVIARDVRRGSVITEADLLPAGTRPGISAGLSSGMAAISILKSNVQGFEKLAVGDRFSILTRVPTQVENAGPSISWATLHGGRLSDEDAKVADMVRTGIREVVADALYLSDSDAENVVIGVPEKQVARLAQLLRDQTEVFAIAKSSQDTSGQGAASEVDIRADQSGDDKFQFVSQLEPAQKNQSVSIPILAREVQPYQRLTIDDFVDPATGRVQTLLFDPEEVQNDWEYDLRELVDRVTLKPLRAGYPVRRSQLAPQETPSGPAVGLKPGQRGLTVTSAQIAGLDALPIGSVFDLATARGVDVQSLADQARQSIASSDAVREAAKLPVGNVPVSRRIASSVRLMADLGEVTINVERPAQVTETQVTLRPDGSTEETTRLLPPTTETQSVRRYVLAVEQSELAAVLGSLDDQNPLMVALRPIVAEVETSSDSQNAPPAIRAVIQEHVRGNEIETEVFLTDQPEFARVSPLGTGGAR